MTVLNKRVEAWKGPRKGCFGLVTRMDGLYHCYVLWDDGVEESCPLSDLVKV